MTLQSPDLLHLAWVQSWQVAVLIVAVALAARLFRRRPHLAYVLWLLVLLKCLTPPLWPSPTSLFSWAQARPEALRDTGSMSSAPQVLERPQTPQVMEEHTSLGVSPPPQAAHPVQGSAALPQPSSSPTRELPSAPGRLAESPKTFVLSWRTCLLALWLLGLTTICAYGFFQWRSCRRRILASSVSVPPSFQSLERDCSAVLGLRRTVRPIVTAEPIGPATIGLFRPAIILPQSLLAERSPEQLRSIITHELAHVRRHDVLFGLLQSAAQALLWFHPLVWWANRQATQTIEHCCDEEALAALRCPPVTYAHCLLDVVQFNHNLSPVLTFPAISSRNVTRRRLEAIMKRSHGFQTRTPLWCWSILLILAAVILPGKGITARSAAAVAAGSMPGQLPQDQQRGVNPTTRPFDAAAFRGLSDEAKRQFVLDVLDSRDRDLQNLCVSVCETDVNINKANGSRRFMTHFRFELKRFQGKLWMHGTQYEYYNPQDVVTGESFMNWDGKAARSLTPPQYNSANRTFCSVSATENDNFSLRRYTFVLGLRATMNQSLSVPQWFRNAVARGVPIDISIAEENGRNLLHIAIDADYYRRELWLDTARGFMITRGAYTLQSGQAKATIDVVKCEKLDGVWIPLKAVGLRGTTFGEENTEDTFEVEKCSVGGVKEADTDITFPVGAEVMDRAVGAHYVIRPDGKFELRPFTDTSGNVMAAFTVPNGTVVDRIDASAAALYSKRELGYRTPPRPGSATRPTTASVMKMLDSLTALYRLADGQNIRKINAPFAKERQAYVDENYPQAAGAENVRSIGFLWSDGKLRDTYMSYVTPTFDRVIRLALQIEWYEIEHLDRIDWKLADCDWVVRSPLPVADRLAALAQVISAETGKPTSFTRRIERRPCILVSGQATSQTVGVVLTLDAANIDAMKRQRPTTRPDGPALKGDFQEAAKLLDAPFLNADREHWPFWVRRFTVAPDARLSRTDPEYHSKLVRIIQNVQAQAGGQWTVEDRDVEVWAPVVQSP